MNDVDHIGLRKIQMDIGLFSGRGAGDGVFRDQRQRGRGNARLAGERLLGADGQGRHPPTAA